MQLNEYLKLLIAQFTEATGNEVTGVKTVQFDIGVAHNGTRVFVNDDSPNRIKFSLEIKWS